MGAGRERLSEVFGGRKLVNSRVTSSRLDGSTREKPRKREVLSFLSVLCKKAGDLSESTGLAVTCFRTCGPPSLERERLCLSLLGCRPVWRGAGCWALAPLVTLHSALVRKRTRADSLQAQQSVVLLPSSPAAASSLSQRNSECVPHSVWRCSHYQSRRNPLPPSFPSLPRKLAASRSVALSLCSGMTAERTQRKQD